MGTLDALKTRYDIAKNMFVRNRRRAWRSAAEGLTQRPLPSENESQTGPIEAYAKAHTTGLGIHEWDHYLPVYDRHFAKFRGTEVHILEIGVFSGGSLEMWQYLRTKGPHLRGGRARRLPLL